MITTKTIHEIHNAKLDTLIYEVRQELILLAPSNKFYKDFFEKNKIKYQHIVDYNLLLKGVHEEIDICLDNSDKYFNIQIRNYNEHFKLYLSKQEEIRKLEAQKINETVFGFILKRFNHLLIEAIVKEGYNFHSLFIGGMKVKVVERVKDEINWGESVKARDILLEQNLIPYIKADAKIAKENNQEYNGVKWIVNLPPITTYFEWVLETAQFFRIPNIKDFKFEPVRGVNSPVTILRRFEETLTKEELFKLYKYKQDVN